MDAAQTVVANAARGFVLYQCEECANSIRDALLKGGHHGQVVELRCVGRRDHIICLSFDNGGTSITKNGRHVGVKVGDLAFDNLHPDGMLYEEWLKDFEAFGGVRIASATDF